MIDPSDQMWAGLHNELSAEEKDALRNALKNSPALRQEARLKQELHRELKSLFSSPGKPMPAGTLEDCLLAAWEEEHPEYSETPPKKASNRRILVFAAPLAAAAALAVMLSLPAGTGSIHWQRAELGAAPQLRGTAQSQPVYSKTDLKELSQELRQTIEQTHSVNSSDWVLKIQLQELAEGALSVEVSGYPCTDPTRSRLWNENFQTLEKFRAELPMFGKRVAGDLQIQAD